MLGQRVAAVGNSGEGKSVLLKALFATQADGIVIDTKQDEEWGDVGRIVKGDEIYRAAEGRYIWQPPPSYMFEDEPRERFFQWALKAGRRAIMVDEFSHTCDSGAKYPRSLKLCVMQGRSRGLGIWGTTQEPLRVPSFLFGQAQHLYFFHIGHPRQQKLAEEFMEAEIPWESISEGSHNFLYKGREESTGPPACGWNETHESKAVQEPSLSL